MSGASGKVPAAINLTPEAALGGPLARVRDGDLVAFDATTETLDLHVDRDELAGGEATGGARVGEDWCGGGKLFSAFRSAVVRPTPGTASSLRRSRRGPRCPLPESRRAESPSPVAPRLHRVLI
jgi:phosphogluconate dehydratase